jgi:hypothetical protein
LEVRKKSYISTGKLHVWGGRGSTLAVNGVNYFNLTTFDYVSKQNRREDKKKCKNEIEV